MDMGSSETANASSAEHIRVTLDLRRSDDPVLFDALALLPKGRRRIARLRVLAHDGLAGAESCSSRQVIEKTPVAGVLGCGASQREMPVLEALEEATTSAVFESPLAT
jgi:hypothetical protein